MDQKTAFRHLTKRVALDKDTVTYRLLSRELGINVKDAKSYLEAYLSDPQAIERGVSPTWAISGVLQKSSKSANGTNGDAMDVDGDEKMQEEEVQRRMIMLVAAADLDAKTALFRSTPPPSKHVYALSPAPPPTLSSLASYALTNISESAQAKWKPAPPAAEGGYGGIVHPDGERKKKGKGKAKAAPVTAPARTNSSTSVASTSAAPAPKAAAKPAASTSTKSKASTSTSKASASTWKPAARPIGQLGGLFAKQAAAASKVKKEVPAKRKASPPPKAKTVTKAVPAPKAKAPPPKKAGRSNGIFGDEELASDEDFDMGGDDFDEEAMREAEMEAEKKAAEKGKAKATRSSAPKEDVKVKKEDGVSMKEKRLKEQKDLKAMFSDDDDMEVDPAPSKPATKKAGPTAAEKRATAAANMKNGNIGNMFSKK